MADQPQFRLETFWQQAARVIDRLLATQSDTIRQAARLLAKRIENNGVIHTYGTGHSRAFAMELVHRAGGLVPFSRIDLEDLALFAGWPLARVKDPTIERDPEAGKALLSCYRIEPE